MTIRGKTIRSITRIMDAVKGAPKVRFAFSIGGLPSETWERAGFPREIQSGQYMIPAAIGKASEFNAQGEAIPQNDRPQETVYHMIWKTFEDWHGGTQSAFVSQPYKRYPRKHIDAPSEAFYALSYGDQPCIVSREIDLGHEQEVAVIHLANLFLEYFGEFDIVDHETGLPAGMTLKRLQWEILPIGVYPWDRAKTFVQKYTSTLDESPRKVLERRMKDITAYDPDFMGIGQGGFRGYFVYGFEKKKIYVLECLFLENATYVFGEDWEQLSRLTKSQIVNGGYEHKRIIHDSMWRHNIKRLLSS